jgi:mRNA interferase MazF
MMVQTYQKGDVIDVNLGRPPKEIKGHEQGMKRPCIIIKSFDNLGLAIIVPCTTKDPKYSIYTIVKIIKGTGGLTTDSFALCHQIRTISFDRILSKRGTLPQNTILKISSVLTDTLDL